jgi:hypothetical protein
VVALGETDVNECGVNRPVGSQESSIFPGTIGEGWLDRNISVDFREVIAEKLEKCKTNYDQLPCPTIFMGTTVECAHVNYHYRYGRQTDQNSLHWNGVSVIAPVPAADRAARPV